MLREISEEVRVNLKDRLREVRRVIRRHRHDSNPVQEGEAAGRPPFPLGEIEGLLGHAVSAFDDAMTMAETLVPNEWKGGRAGEATPRPLGDYFTAEAPLDGERAFRRDFYALTRAVLAGRQIGDIVVREASFTSVHADVLRDQAQSFARLKSENVRAERVALVAGIISKLIVELVRHDPLRSIEGANMRLESETTIICLVPVALACGLATMDPYPEIDLLETATLAVDAWLDRNEAATAEKDSRGELTAILVALLTHLP